MRVKIKWPCPSFPMTVYCPKLRAEVPASTCTRTTTTVAADGIPSTDWKCAFFDHIEIGSVICSYVPAEGDDI